VETPAPLNELIMAQTAESLAALSANLTQAMTRANQVISTAFIDQAKDAANWQPDPLGMQVALNDVWSHLAGSSPKHCARRTPAFGSATPRFGKSTPPTCSPASTPKKARCATSASRIPNGAQTPPSRCCANPISRPPPSSPIS
jgi:hypothetical protein